ncbi:hypothetical protein [Azotobacter salinestris]|uniref:hypothetical protein n=1 Tax=Azotobacter salinestris TaxID=69964 RepID=UPI0012668F1C|nr:hypothetical protein [Azotobacter salinestris]
MEQDKVRAEFEAWWIDSKHDGEPDFIKRAMWAGWQASRAAMVVELPPCPQPELEGAEEEDMEAFYALSGLHHAFRAAIEAAGIRTK